MRHRRKRRHLLGFSTKLFFVLIVAAGLWGAGFFVFLDQIPRAQATADGASKVDAIVVLTGGGGRLEMGFRLLAHGDAAKLFISGVDPGVDETALLGNRQLDAATLDCCIALGRAADDTFGNATETARWMEAEGFTSLYIVTANYHMPRSLIEFRAALPEADLLPRAVHPGNVHLEDWWHWPGTVQLLAVEYTKYLATRARILLRP
jgi:uncharacterized SAM-binding protein YcdF (DUF218 family)